MYLNGYEDENHNICIDKYLAFFAEINKTSCFIKLNVFK